MLGQKIKIGNEIFNKYFSKYKYFALVLIIGIIFIGFPVGNEKPKEIVEMGSFNVESFEEKLENTISNIDGVGKTKIILTLKSTEESIYATDIKRNHEQGTRQNLEENITILSSGNYGEEPLLIKKIYPSFKGVGVICEGGDNSSVRLKVTELLSSVLGITSDNISISKMKNK